MQGFGSGVIGRALVALCFMLSACGGGGGSSDSDPPAANSAPVANASASQGVLTGRPVTLDGSGSSDPDGNTLAFSWTLSTVPPGSAAVLTDASSTSSSFTPDVAGIYLATLVVSDGRGGSASTSVMITVENSRLTLVLAPATGCVQDCNDSTVSLPYDESEFFAPTCSADTCPETLEVRVFRLKAEGGAFTVTGLAAENLTPSGRRDAGPLSLSVPAVVPAFDGLREDQVIGAGETITFRLVATRTYGATATLRFSFRILETNEQFQYSVQMTSN